MKKLLCLVFVLIALLGLAFAISAENRTNLANWDNSKLYNSDGSLRTEGKWGCTNGDTYMYNIFDGNKTDGIYLNNAGVYCLTDLNKSLLGGYYVTDIAISHIGGTKYSLYYKFGAGEWIPVVEDTKTSGTYTYSINDYATQVKYVFVEAPSWNKQLCEIEVFGIDPAEMTCEHPNLASQPWVEIPNSATCNDFGYQKQICPDCKEEFTRKTSEVPALGHDLSTKVTKPGTSVSYGEGTIVCSRCDYAMDFKGEVDLTEDYYMSIGSSSDFVNVFVSSIADKWGASSIENMFNDRDGDWTCYNHETWFADSFSDEANYNDENEWADMIFTGNLDLTKIVICVPNDSAATLRISTYDEETGSYVVLKELPTYDESLPAGLGGITMTISMLGTTVDDLRIQVISPSKWHDGYQYYSMIIGELRVYGIAPGCGLDATNHECVFDKFVGYAENSAPTCQRVGRAVYQCTCNEQETREVQPSEEFHNYIEVEGTRVNSTCTVAGSYTGTCEYCEDTKEFELELDNETGHNYEETGRTDATCIAVGSIEYKCSACEATKSEEIALVDHAYGEAVVVPSTCKVAGTSTVTCSACGNEEVTALDLAAHAYDVETDDPTCEDTGLKTSTCVVCGDVQEEVIEKLGHTWVLDEDGIEEEPTCGTEGKGAYYCSVCSETKNDVIPKTGEHTWNEDYDEIVVPPTCEGTGAAQFSCVYCSATEKRGIKALGHDFSVEVEGTRVEATCTTDGSYIVNCANGCGKSQTKTIAALDHDWADATCLAPKTCMRENCGATEGGLADHTWGIVACTAGNCVVCGAENPDADKVAHKYSWNVKDEDGNIVSQEHGCSVCGATPGEPVMDETNGYYVADGLGFNVFYVYNWDQLKAATTAAVKDDVIRLAKDIDFGGGKNGPVWTPNKEIIIDLGGFTLTGAGGYANIQLQTVTSFGNGTVIHNGGTCAIKVWYAESIEDLDVYVQETGRTNVGGVVLRTDKTTLNGEHAIKLIKNVTIQGADLINNGLEALGGKIDKIENLKVYANSQEGKGQAFSTKAEVGTIKNSEFYGNNIGFDIMLLKGEFKLENCIIYGGNIGVQIDAVDANGTFSAGSDTTFMTDNALFDVKENFKESNDLSVIETTVASVNNKLYSSMEAAFAALAASTEEVTKFALMADVELPSAIVVENNVEFSFGGATYTYVKDGYSQIVTIDGFTMTMPNDTEGNGAFWVKKGGKLTINGNGTVNSVGNNKYSIAVWADGGEVIINGGTFTNVGAGDDDHYDLIYVKHGGSVEINGGTFKAQTPKWTLNINDDFPGTIVVNGGTYYGFNPAEVYSEPNAPVSFVSEKAVCIYENEDGAYILASKHRNDHGSNDIVNNCHEDFPASCTEYGYRAHTCLCGDVRIETLENKKPTGHKWVDATCLAPKTCSVCNETEGEVLPHNYVPVVNEDGSTTYTCQNGCNDSYVINNAAVNGTYCMLGMPANSVLVFANGALTVDGVEGFTYTYNVTTGMIETTLGTFFQVIDGKIYHRGSQELKVHSYVAEVTAPTCTDKGYTTYTCPACNDTYKDNETAALGHTEAIDQAVAPTCTTTGLTEGKHCSVCNEVLVAQDTVDALGHTEAIDQAVAPTCTATGLTEGKHCSVCNVTLVAQDTVDALGHTEAIDQAVAPTCTETGLTEGKHCSVCNEVLVAQDTVDALGHTEVEIAPIPSYKDVNKKVVAGMSSGVECSVCGTVITQPVVVNKFYVQGNRLSLSDYVNVDYGLVVPDNYTNVYVVYVSDANVDSDSVVVQYDGSGISTYRGIRMQNLGDNIHATMYATTPEGLTAVFVQAEYSVRTYCVNQLAKDSNGAEFKTMISDLIEAGAIAQQIKKYKLDQLVNKGADIEGLLTPSTNTTISGEKIDTSVVYNSELNQKASITNKNLSVGNAMAVQFLLTIKSDVLANVRLEVVVDRSAQKLSNLTYTYSMAEENIEVYNASKSQYIVKVPDLRVIEYDAPIIATIYVGDEAVQQQTYSVNTYFENNYAKTSVDATMRKFLLAMYNYGMSAAAYKNA